MKIFAVICLFFALSSAEYVVKTHEDLMQYGNECVDEHHISEAHVEQYKQSQYPDDNITHCYMKCVYSKSGLFDVTGFNAEHIHQQLMSSNDNHDTDMHAEIEKCIDKNEQGSDECEWAYRGATCLMKNGMQMVKESTAAPME